jgi:hypothetical protein
MASSSLTWSSKIATLAELCWAQRHSLPSWMGPAQVQPAVRYSRLLFFSLPKPEVVPAARASGAVGQLNQTEVLPINTLPEDGDLGASAFPFYAACTGHDATTKDWLGGMRMEDIPEVALAIDAFALKCMALKAVEKP